MVEEVNKIVYNMLIGGKGVVLPGVGTLFVERQGAKRLSADRLLSPRNAVNFSSQEQGTSLVDEIVAIAGCGEEQARDIYDRWLAKTREGKTLTIAGVGVLNDKSFSPEKEFNAAINPGGVKTLVLKRRSNGWLYAVSGVCAAVALCVGAYMLWGDSLFGGVSVVRGNGTGPDAATVADSAGKAPAISGAPTPAEPGNAPREGDSATSGDDAAGETEAVSPQDQSTNKTSTNRTPARSTSPQDSPSQGTASRDAASDGKATQGADKPAGTAPAGAAVAVRSGADYAFWVVMGVFSTEQNASRALEQAGKKIKDLDGRIVPFRDKYIAALFGSDDRADCNAFARSYRDIYPDLWVYEAKR